MSSNRDDPEYSRYLAYLQRSVVDGETPVVDDPTKINAWIRGSRKKLETQAFTCDGQDARSLVDDYAQRAARFVPTNEYDSFHAQEIFQPILCDVKAACAQIGIGPVRPVTFANSPAIAPTPFARPSPDSDADHLLLAGAGTFAFCNYWGKAFADLLATLGGAAAPARLHDADLGSLLRAHRGLLALPVRLAVYFAFHETLIGFGQVQQRSPALAYRLEIVHAMEVFAIAHEFGHFIIEERCATTDSSRRLSKEVELQADLLGFCICRYVGGARSDWLSYTGVGALAFFRAVQLCEDARAVVTGSESISDSHPTSAERIAKVCDVIREGTSEDDRELVLASVAEYEAALTALRSAIGEELIMLSEQVRNSPSEPAV